MSRYDPQPITQPSDIAGINNNLTLIAIAIASLLDREGSLPNAMLSDLDMNSFKILNQANPVVLNAFNWRGAWVTDTAYEIGDAVFFNSSAYYCGINHTSSVSFLTDLLANKWQAINLGNIFKGDWTGNTPYFFGDIVINSNQFYTCIQNHLSGVSFNPTFWEIYGSFGSMAAQNANAVNITGGSISNVGIESSTINDTTIGGSTPNEADFTIARASEDPTNDDELTRKDYVDSLTEQPDELTNSFVKKHPGTIFDNLQLIDMGFGYQFPESEWVVVTAGTDFTILETNELDIDLPEALAFGAGALSVDFVGSPITTAGAVCSGRVISGGAVNIAVKCTMIVPNGYALNAQTFIKLRVAGFG